jgi:hypothetical protein
MSYCLTSALYIDPENGSVKEHTSCPKSPSCPLWDSLQGCKDAVLNGQVFESVSKVSLIIIGDCIK